MQPPDFPRNQVAADELRKLSKGASGRTVSQGPTMLGPSSMFASSRSGSGRKGHGSSGHMKGADDSAGSSRTGTPPVKEKESASHANQFR